MKGMDEGDGMLCQITLTFPPSSDLHLPTTAVNWKCQSRSWELLLITIVGHRQTMSMKAI